MRDLRPAALVGFLSAVALAGAAAEGSENVLVVMSAETGPYLEAFSGIQDELGALPRAVTAAREPPHIPPAAAVVVTLGARASSWEYPARVRVIQAMTPGLPANRRRGVLVAMEPEPATLVDRLRALQPNLRRLGVVFQTEEAGRYAGALARAGAERGVGVDARAVEEGVELPDVLRGMSGEVDALWVPPDPMLVTATNLSTFVEFARANRISLYVPTGGLVAMGATAAVAPSFREIGRRSAQADEPAGGPVLYPRKVETTVSRKGAAEAGLALGEADFRKADKVLP